tara:strand:+ start:4527 stop:6722 length:2196 start_codon:yes stop_codon:yes gene_type:complete
MAMLGASYAVGETACAQEDLPSGPWLQTNFHRGSYQGDPPSRDLWDVWEDMLPVKPAKRSFWEKLQGKKALAGDSRSPTVQAQFKNARALQNRLHLAGWLEADVQSSWTVLNRGTALDLHVILGRRWHLAGITWNLDATGLTVQELELPLQRGLPFAQDLLRGAQDHLALQIQSAGRATFHSGLLVFTADTLGRSDRHEVWLTVEALPWHAEGTEWHDPSLPTDSMGNRPHPKVEFGSITWEGQVPSDSGKTGSLRADVWRHLVDLKAQKPFTPRAISKTLQGFQSLPSVAQVQLGKTFRLEAEKVLMDVDIQIQQRPSHDVGFELDLVRNDTRYGPKLGTSVVHRNPRGWGAKNAVEFGFGYVAVAPFATLSRDNLLNSGEWYIRWHKERLGIWPLSLDAMRPSTQPNSEWDLGWEREVWPEFTRSQFHGSYEVSWTENPTRNSKVALRLVDLAFVNLTNRDSLFVQWLDSDANDLVKARFNNHLTLASGGSWETEWRGGNWSGQAVVQSMWAGWLSQALASRLAAGDSEWLDPQSGAWTLAKGVPSIQFQRHQAVFQGRKKTTKGSAWYQAFNLKVGWAGTGANTPALPLEHSFFGGGANGIRGWRIRTLGPGRLASSEETNAVVGIGDVRLDINVESRFKLSPTWGLALFTDAGNVWLHGTDVPEEAQFSLGTMGWSAGMGVRYDLGFFLIRVDAALRAHDPGRPAGSRWIGQALPKGAVHLGLGLPF